MCGIFGIIAKKNRFIQRDIRTALDTITHRGPDDWGLDQFEVGDWEIWLGQRRLSILDLSQNGHQPMSKLLDNISLRAVVFNGEIYNYKELKNELKDRWSFQTQSDTEVLLAGMTLIGPEFLKNINGMLAAGFLNAESKKITLARDRIGKKPLYIYHSQDLIVFSSELKPIVKLGLPLTLNEQAMSYFRWLGYIPAQLTIYQECNKLSAASYLNVDLSKNKLQLSPEQLYWDPFTGYTQSYRGSYSDAIKEFLFLLDDATKIRLEADVPVGTFLSGGIDSSLVTSSIKQLGKEDVKAFTVKFNDPEFDESSVAVETCKQLNFPLEILLLQEKNYENQINKISCHYDEPFSDSSQIPTLAIAEAASKYIKVVLTGDGGDEVFLGYPRYSYINKLNVITHLKRSIPFSQNLGLYFLSTKLGVIFFKRLLKFFGVSSTNLDSKIFRAKEILESKSKFHLYDTVISTNSRINLEKEGQNKINFYQSYYEQMKNFYPNYNWDALKRRSTEEQLAALDLISYMRDDVLVKVDRATMAYSLEARSPLLDYRIVEFGTSLPLHYKMKNGIAKSLLRDALSTRLKGNISTLPKKGFGIPLPTNLPQGTTMASRWNLFVENEWRKKYEC